MLTNSNVTIYNSYIVDGNDTYARCIIQNVNWFGRTKTNVTDGGLIAANEYVVRIPLTAIFEKTYIEPIYFFGVDKEKFFTLKSGDLIVKGDVYEENPTKKLLLNSYSEVITVVGVTDNRRGSENMRHWKVVGK